MVPAPERALRAALSLLAAAAHDLLAVRERLHLLRSPPEPMAPLRAEHLTTVCRLPPDVATSLTAPLRGAGPVLRVYPPPDVHVTLLDLDARRHAGREAAVAAVAADALAAVPPLRVVLGRYGVTRFGLHVEVVDRHGDLRRARTTLARALDLHPPVSRRLLGVANLARFALPAQPPLDVRRLPRVDRELVLTTAEVVLTDKVLSRKGTAVLRTVRLGRPQAP